MTLDEIYRLPLERRAIGPLLGFRARQDADRPCLTWGQQTFSFAEADRLSRAVARGLLRRGIGRGDRVAMLLPNGPDFVWAWYGCALLGATMVPVNNTYIGEMFDYVLRDSGSRGLIVHADLAGAVATLSSATRSQIEWVAVAQTPSGLPEAPQPSASLPAGFEPFTDLMEFQGGDPEVSCDHRDIQTIMYTSGTTGPSKGVVMPNGHFFASAMVFLRALGLTRDDVLFTPLPLFHGLASRLGVLPCLMVGAHVVIAPRFSASQFWEQVCAANATVAHTIFSLPPMLKAQPVSPWETRHRLRAMYNSNYDPEFEERFKVRVVEAYGLTETGLTIYSDWPERRPGSCGRIDQDWEARIVGDDGRELPPGESGELIVRPRLPWIMMRGYLNKPEATLESIRDLWFHTGDYARRDEEGFFYFSGRKKERIRRRGENISAWDIEKIVGDHPGISECAALAHPSPVGEDDVRLVVVPATGAQLEPLSLMIWLESQLPPLMVPRYIEIVDALPRTPSNKVEKYKLISDGLTSGAWDREKAGYRLKGERIRKTNPGTPAPDTSGRR
jgi:crotonobetaine/carnitine-CoA ligase